MSTTISFSEVVNAVSNGKSFIKKNYKGSNNVDINTNDFVLDKYKNGVSVYKHIPTGASVRAFITHPLGNIRVENIEVMPKGKKAYTYITDHLVTENGYSMNEVITLKAKKTDSFNIGLLWKL